MITIRSDNPNAKEEVTNTNFPVSVVGYIAVLGDGYGRGSEA